MIEKFFLIACYFAPSKVQEEQIARVSSIITANKSYKIVLIGDFNLRSRLYEKLTRYDFNVQKRAEIFEEFLI